MKRLFTLFALLPFIACKNSGKERTRTTESGLRYTIHHASKPGKRVAMMATAKLTVTHFRNDTPVAARMPVYQMVLPPAPYTTDPIAEVMIRGEVVEGDSIVTLTKDNRCTAFTIQKIFILGENGMNTDSLIQIDKNTELKKLSDAELIKAGRRIGDYLEKNNISAEKINDNVYVQFEDKGSALKADSGKKAGIKFKISELYTGKVINTNTDTAFHQPPVLEFVTGRGFMLKPVDHALSQMGKGGHARIYIPGVLAAGKEAADPSVDITKDILFEVEVVSVKK
jgi:FKBP-type peptidyl-prolyl cis-trans isomerase